MCYISTSQRIQFEKKSRYVSKSGMTQVAVEHKALTFLYLSLFSFVYQPTFQMLLILVLYYQGQLTIFECCNHCYTCSEQLKIIIIIIIIIVIIIISIYKVPGICCNCDMVTLQHLWMTWLRGTITIKQPKKKGNKLMFTYNILWRLLSEVLTWRYQAIQYF